MRYLTWILRFVLFLLLLTFALKNTDDVTVRYYLGMEWRAPLAMVIFVAFLAGAAIGVVAGLFGVRRRRPRTPAAPAGNPPPADPGL